DRVKANDLRRDASSFERVGCLHCSRQKIAGAEQTDLAALAQCYGFADNEFRLLLVNHRLTFFAESYIDRPIVFQCCAQGLSYFHSIAGAYHSHVRQHAQESYVLAGMMRCAKTGVG